MLGFYSEYLYKRWYHANVPLHTFAADYGQIERRSATTLSVQEFIDNYDSVSKPLLITDLTSKWPATENWTKDNLIKNYGDMVKLNELKIDFNHFTDCL